MYIARVFACDTIRGVSESSKIGRIQCYFNRIITIILDINKPKKKKKKKKKKKQSNTHKLQCMHFAKNECFFSPAKNNY